MVARHLSLIVPGALGPLGLVDPAQLPSLKSFTRLLGRSHSQPAYRGLESQLFALFGYDSDHGDLPVAPLTYALESGSAPEGWCLRADPVFLVPGRTSLMMMGDGGDLRLSLEEARTLAADLNQHFEAEGLRFEAVTPAHWYLFTDPQQVQTTPLGEVMGLAVQEHLPQGRDGVRWHGLLAEAQMLLHDHAVNRARADRGLPQVNSLWFWGGGEMPQGLNGDWRRVWSDASLPAALAHAVDIPRSARPADATEWLAHAEPGSHIILLTDLMRLMPDMTPEAWGETMSDLEVRWWQPLWQALRKGELQGLDLYPLDGHRYHLDRKGSRRWWRRPARLAPWLEASRHAQTY